MHIAAPFPVSSVVEVTGCSTSLSFDEAFADALKQVPNSGMADGMKTLQVTEIGGRFGGFAGFHELYVKVKATIN